MKQYIVLCNNMTIEGEFDSYPSASAMAEAKNNTAIRNDSDLRYKVYELKEKKQ